MEFGPLDGGDHDVPNSVGFLEISKTFVTQDTFFFGMISFDKVYIISITVDTKRDG